MSVIPVDEWYNFKKPSVVKEKFLDAIEEDYELQKKLLKEKGEKYKRITSVLWRSENDEEDQAKGVFGSKDKAGKRKSKGKEGGASKFNSDLLVSDFNSMVQRRFGINYFITRFMLLILSPWSDAGAARRARRRWRSGRWGWRSWDGIGWRA